MGAQVVAQYNPEKQVSVSDLSSGIYSVWLTMNDGTSLLKKMIKN